MRKNKKCKKLFKKKMKMNFIKKSSLREVINSKLKLKNLKRMMILMDILTLSTQWQT